MEKSQALQPMERFTAVLRAYLQKQKLPLSFSREELTETLALTDRQECTPLFATALLETQPQLSPALSHFLRTKQMQAIWAYEQRAYLLQNVSTLLQQAKIPYVPMKGAILQELYPEPWLRTSRDLDILVQESTYPQAVQLLSQHYTLQGQSAYHAVFLSSEGLKLELHFTLIKKTHQKSSLLQNPWSEISVSAETLCGTMSPELFLLYHTTHMAGHFFESGGCGIRPFLDLWLMQQSSIGNESLYRSYLESVGLLPFFDAAVALSAVWLEDTPPTPLTQAMQDYLLSAKSYGALENRVLTAKTGLSPDTILSRIFPPYQQMRYEYPILQKYPILLPYYELYRLIKTIGSGRIRRFLRELRLRRTVSTPQQKAIADLMEQLGFSKYYDSK